MPRERRLVRKFGYIIVFIIMLVCVYTIIERNFQISFKDNEQYVSDVMKRQNKENHQKLIKSLSVSEQSSSSFLRFKKTTVSKLTARTTTSVRIKNFNSKATTVVPNKDFTSKTTTVAPNKSFKPNTTTGVATKDFKSNGTGKVTNESTSKSISEFALYLRMFHLKRRLYESVFVQSMRFFWTIKAPLVVVLDSNEMDKKFGKEIKKVYPFPEVRHEAPFPTHFYHGNGHSLQQLSMFHVEKCFHKKYVGFVDTDTMFVTMVTPDQLFIDGKPVIIGQYGSASDSWWYRASKMTALALGKKEVFRCMSYFPVMMKVEHIIEMRNYMAKLHKTDFNSAFKKFSVTGIFSQFSIMCNYVWYFHRDEYVFHAQLRPSNGIWNGEYTSPGRHGPDYYKENVPEEMRHPVTRPAIHYRYSYKWQDQNTFRKTLKAALCYSGGFDLCPDLCQPFNRTDLDRYMFHFEFNDWTWDKRCIIAQRNHIKNIEMLNKTDTKERILHGCKVVDKLSYRL